MFLGRCDWLNLQDSVDWRGQEKDIRKYSTYLLRRVGRNRVQLVSRPLLELLYQPRIIGKYGAFGGTRIGRGNPPEFHSVQHKSHMT
jgi:hypothetical protein